MKNRNYLRRAVRLAGFFADDFFLVAAFLFFAAINLIKIKVVTFAITST
jgi:hypothetical protein